VTSTDTEMDGATKEKLMGQAYSAAQKDLREAHQDEFNRFYQKQLASRGITWSPKKSKEEAALDQIVALIEENPKLAERLIERLTHLQVEAGNAEPRSGEAS
jgi:hypothetical protein